MHPSRFVLLLAIAFIWFETIAMNDATSSADETVHKRQGVQNTQFDIKQAERDLIRQQKYDEMVRKEKLQNAGKGEFDDNPYLTDYKKK
jgi:hypothetical protein